MFGSGFRLTALGLVQSRVTLIINIIIIIIIIIIEALIIIIIHDTCNFPTPAPSLLAPPVAPGT